MLTFNLLHLAYHVTMLSMYQPLDRVLNVISLGLLVLVSIILVLPYPRDGGESGSRR
jgi:hypothetical protein